MAQNTLIIGQNYSLIHNFERANEWIDEKMRAASSADQVNEWVVRANKQMNKRVAQYSYLDSWLFWPIVHSDNEESIIWPTLILIFLSNKYKLLRWVSLKRPWNIGWAPTGNSSKIRRILSYWLNDWFKDDIIIIALHSSIMAGPWGRDREVEERCKERFIVLEELVWTFRLSGKWINYWFIHLINSQISTRKLSRYQEGSWNQSLGPVFVTSRLAGPSFFWPDQVSR